MSVTYIVDVHPLREPLNGRWGRIYPLIISLKKNNRHF